MATSSSSSPTFTNLMRDIRAGRLAPVYLLYGEEGFFIDRLIELFEKLIPEDVRDFNLFNFYGTETTGAEVASTAMRYPVMSDRQVVILREAHSMRATEIEHLAPYVAHASPTTVLVVAMRGTRETKGKEFVSAVKKHGVVFESKKLTDREVPTYISNIIKENKLNIEGKGLAMLQDYVGNDLSRIHNEITKLTVALPAGATITPEVIEKNIGVSKDYNNFELIDALATRNVGKAFTIVSYFASNPKNNPTVITVSTLFNYFSNLMIYHFNPDKSVASQCKALGLKSEWQLKKFVPGARNYNASMVIEIIGAIREMDVRSKGVGSRANQYDLLRDLVFRILSARGNLQNFV